MKRLVTVTLVAALCVTSLAIAQTATTQPAESAVPQTQPAGDAFKTQMDKVSYAIGVGLATDSKKQDVEINIDMVMQGFKDAAANKALLNDQQLQETMMAFRQELMTKYREKQAKLAETNKKEGEEFLAKNAKEEGVVTLPSGLQYKVIKEGEGPTPTITDTVDVRYRGTLIDGTEFDSSGEGTRPFPVSGVVRGMSEALQKMPTGSKWKLFIPGDLAYGSRAPSPTIGPNSTLIFDVEVVGIHEPAGGAAAGTQPGRPGTPPNIRMSPATRPAAE